MTPHNSAGGGVKCEINVTPLVDVCLVLLIIFLVVAPMIVDKADLPETAAPQRMAADEHDLELSIDAKGQVEVAERQVGMDALAAMLRDAHRVTPNRHVVLKADRALRYEDVRALLKTVADAGFSGAGLAMHQKRPNPIRG